MSNLSLVDAETVAVELGVSREFAYRLIRKMNDELKKDGCITVAGRINREYFEENKFSEGML